MMFAEVLLLVAGVAGICHLRRPLQRALERYLARKFSHRGSWFPRKTMDVLARRGTLLQGAM